MYDVFNVAFMIILFYLNKSSNNIVSCSLSRLPRQYMIVLYFNCIMCYEFNVAFIINNISSCLVYLHDIC